MPTVFGETWLLLTERGNNCYSGFIDIVLPLWPHTEPLSVLCFPFFAVGILPNGNQQTDLMSIDSLSTVTSSVTGEGENSRETVFIPSFSCTVNCIRVQCVHSYSVIG